MLEKIAAYVKHCFEDSARAEQRVLKPTDYSMNFILLTECVELGGKTYFLPFFKCKYGRVLRRVAYRLANNLEKNFGVCYEENRYSYYPYGSTGNFGEVADPNYAIAFIEEDGKRLTIAGFNPAIYYNSVCPYRDIACSCEGIRECGSHEMYLQLLSNFWSNMSFSRYKKLYAKTYGAWPERKLQAYGNIKLLSY